MGYLKREIAVNAIKRMQQFESQLKDIYEENGLEFRTNKGRRNAILSQAQEVFFADELNNAGEVAIVDGRSGYPDIVVNSRHCELECKLTSGSGGSWMLQTDYTTLEKKGSLDFLYVLVDADFEKFAVLHFSSLSKDHFHVPASGSRGRAQMNKAAAMDSCEVIVGNVKLKNEMFARQYDDEFTDCMNQFLDKCHDTIERIQETTAPKKRKTLEDGKYNMISRFSKKLQKLSDKRTYWMDAPLQFSIELEKI